MFSSVLALNILTGPLITVVFILAGGIAVALLMRKPTVSWLVTAAIALGSGAVAAAIALWLVNDVYDTFGMPLTAEVGGWVFATFAGLALALVSLWRSRWWRKIVALVGVPVFIIAGTLGINAYFGLNPTLGSLFGVTPEKPIALAPQRTEDALISRPDTRPLWLRWKPPSTMPKVGQIGTQAIPNTLSGFHSRPAGLYLPPAALVSDPPPLPVVVLMMGQPGNPDPTYVQSVLDAFAAKNNGLAPIVVVADQLGDPALDPACTDSSRYGKAETFIMRDVVGWIKENLNVVASPQAWTIAGYSNGGACALTYAAKYPQVWGNVLDISGEEYPGADHAEHVLEQIFGGDRRAYEDQMPSRILPRSKYPNSVGVFTVGSDDAAYIKHVTRSYEAAKAAGFDATYFEVPNGGHVLGALLGGLRKGFDVLYPRLELSKPAGWVAPIAPDHHTPGRKARAF